VVSPFQEPSEKVWYSTSLIQGRPVYLIKKSQKCDFCDFSLQYIVRLPWITKAFFLFENIKFGFSACFYSLDGSFPEKKLFEIFSRGWSLLCSSSWNSNHLAMRLQQILNLNRLYAVLAYYLWKNLDICVHNFQL
jgi:hypothetical protein